MVPAIPAGCMGNTSDHDACVGVDYDQCRRLATSSRLLIKAPATLFLLKLYDGKASHDGEQSLAASGCIHLTIAALASPAGITVLVSASEDLGINSHRTDEGTDIASRSAKRACGLYPEEQ